MADDDLTYYRHRVEAELERAQQSLDPGAVTIHYQLANAYLERISILETIEAGDCGRLVVAIEPEMVPIRRTR